MFNSLVFANSPGLLPVAVVEATVLLSVLLGVQVAVAFRVFSSTLITQPFPPMLPTIGHTRMVERQPWDLPQACQAHTDRCPRTDIRCFDSFQGPEML